MKRHNNEMNTPEAGQSLTKKTTSETLVSPEDVQLLDKLQWDKDWPQLKALLEKSPNLLQYRNDEGETLLHRILKLEDYNRSITVPIENFEWIAEKAPNLLQETNNAGETILHYAVENLELSSLKRIVNKEPGLLQITNNAGDTILHYATIGSDYQVDFDEVITFLIHKEPELLLKKNNAGETIWNYNHPNYGTTNKIGWVYQAVGNSYYELGEIAKAFEFYKQALTVCSELDLPWFMEDDLNHDLNIISTHFIPMVKKIISSYENKKESENSEYVIQNAKAIFANCLVKLTELTQIHKEKNYIKALELYLSAGSFYEIIELDPENKYGFTNKAHYENGNQCFIRPTYNETEKNNKISSYNEALKSYKKSIELDPNFADVYIQAETISRALGQITEADAYHYEASKFVVEIYNKLTEKTQDNENHQSIFPPQLNELIMGYLLNTDPEEIKLITLSETDSEGT